MHHNRIRTQKNTKIHERKKKKKLKNEQPGTPTAVRELVDQRQSEQRDDGADCVVKDDSFRPLLQSNEINPAVLSARSERILWLFHLSRPPKKLRALLLPNDFVTDRPTDSRTNERNKMKEEQGHHRRIQFEIDHRCCCTGRRLPFPIQTKIHPSIHPLLSSLRLQVNQPKQMRSVTLASVLFRFHFNRSRLFAFQTLTPHQYTCTGDCEKIKKKNHKREIHECNISA
jgi:hypothetical protein